MRLRRLAVGAVLALGLVGGTAGSALASPSGDLDSDIVIGGGVCSEKDVIIIVPNPVNDDTYRVCFDYPWPLI